MTHVVVLTREKGLSVGGQEAGEGAVPDSQQRTHLAGIRQHAQLAWVLHPNLPWSLWGINWETRGPSDPEGLREIQPPTPGPEGFVLPRSLSC